MMTVASIWAYVQYRSLDSAAAGNALALATEGYPLLNKAYRLVFGKSSRRSTLEDATTLGTSIDLSLFPTQSRLFLTPQTLTDILEVYYFGTTASSENASVSCSVVGTSQTLTTASDFLAALVEPGSRVVRAANIPARTYVKSIESGISLTMSDLSTTFTAQTVSFRPTRAFANEPGVPLQQEDHGQLMRLIARKPRFGRPAVYGIRRAQAATLTGVGNIEIAMYPVPDGVEGGYQRVFFPMLVRYALTDLSATTDVLDVEDGEDYLVGDIAAYFSCVMQGRGEIADRIMNELPDYLQESAKMAAKTLPQSVPAIG
jgi:hypothetical protein